MNPNDLNDFLHRNKMTGNDLAVKLGVHWTTISRWRNGREPIPKTVELALKWIEATYVSSNDRRTELANDLVCYNLWRRGAEDIEQPSPTDLGILIDEAVEELRR